ncbi:hypothetical protein HDU67_008296 [Dinochytrium kinnereticum]|nr:hypothetical protein HDU67_008296 [Dinochytrium kinnereticum]
MQQPATITISTLLRTSAIASGYLGKLSSSDSTGLPFWKKRFIVLSVDAVYAFRSGDNHNEPSIGRLVLDDSSQAFVCEHGLWVVEVRTALMNPHDSKEQLLDEDNQPVFRTWTLQCASRDDMVEWLGHFKKTIGYVKAMAAQSTSSPPTKYGQYQPEASSGPGYPNYAGTDPLSIANARSASKRSATTRTAKPRNQNPVASLEPVLALLDQMEIQQRAPPPAVALTPFTEMSFEIRNSYRSQNSAGSIFGWGGTSSVGSGVEEGRRGAGTGMGRVGGGQSV